MDPEVPGMSADQKSLFQTLRLRAEGAAKAKRVTHGWASAYAEDVPKLLSEVNRLMRVYAAAADFVDDPFGSLDQRKFYALREAFYPGRDE